MEQQLLGYEGTLYRLDQTEHIAGRLDRVLLGVVPGADDRQSQTKWTVKLTWFLNTVCGELEQNATKERLLRWLPQLEDLDACGRLSWGSAVLDWMYRQMCRTTEYDACNLGGYVSLLLSWAYYRIPLLRPDGFDTRRFPLVERWVQYRLDNDRGEGRLRHFRHVLNRIGCSPPTAGGSSSELSLKRTDHRLHIHHHIDLCPSLPYMTWYLQWAHTEFFGQGDQHLVLVGVVLKDLPIYHPPAPELHQPEDGHLPELCLSAGKGRGKGWGRGRGRGRRGGGRGREGVTSFTGIGTQSAP
ncbi:hypothetical protein Ahy_A06g028195 [Arachis hypogaea]|uniref:Aminotransferase-like plant mobile domain-containing protein n=1 Tax=Arachis hypogaea TaxID=3818 RepID=A0A445CQM4_ARAHY|nr:hypothetical protein Ahy_A06g028195 [Arachis hypogaea]